MSNKKFNATLISFEGIEGCGKSTQIERLKQALTSKGYQVFILREPGASEVGEKIRNLLLNSSQEMNPLTEAFLFMASRVEMITSKISPLLTEKKNVIILDRFLDSTFAYQGQDPKISTWLEQLHQNPPLDLRPDITFLLRIDYQTSLERQAHRGQKKDYFENRPQEYYEKLIERFDQLAQIFSERIISIDASQKQDQVELQIQNQLNKKGLLC